MTQLIQGSFTDEMKSKYLTYAMSTITSRALPDVRDGLKPVHRRILYAMRLLKLDPEKGYKKSARVVGDVIGKYHPHGDQSVYDAMVRLAQDFSVRYPLVDGQGNFGNVDGDSAAAMRYTESRLTKVAEWIMKDLDQGTVDFRLNYDESEDEPIVMPSCFPNLLANGSNGIAVGLSTSIPPHNVGELCGAMGALLKNPNTRDETLLNYIQGPDLPTGGILVETRESMQETYATGKGAFRVRARWEKEDTGRGQYQIVITEIPYQVQKSRLIEKLADLVVTKKVPWLADVMDESDENVRIVLEPKNRNVDPESLMETLFKMSDLETRVSLNMNVITGHGTPALLSLKDTLQQFLDHRREVLVRRSQWRMDKIDARLHLLAAYMVVYLNIDEVIEIIKNNDHPAPIMMERFKIDEIQAEAILNMRLRRLRKLEEIEIQKEMDGLRDERAGLQLIMDSEEEQTRVLLDEVKAIKKEFADDRRTSVEDAPTAEVISIESMIEKEPVTVLVSEMGWVRSMKGHWDDEQEAKYKEGDAEAYRVTCQTTDNICLMGSSGRFYTLPVSKLPAGRGFGEPLSLTLDMQQGEIISAAFIPTAEKYMLATEQGSGFMVPAENLQAQVRSGKSIVNVNKGDIAKYCLPVTGDMVACIGSSRRMLIFSIAEVPEMNRGKGVRLMALKGGELADLIMFNANQGIGLNNIKGTRNRVFTDYAIWNGKRAQVGKLPPHGFQNGATFFLPDAKAVAESKEEEKEEDNRLDELLKAITSPKDEEAEKDNTLDLFEWGEDDEDVL